MSRITQKQILDAVNLLLVDAFPDVPQVSREVVPEDFPRPCFHLLAGKRTAEPATCFTEVVAQPITVQCIAEVDDRGNVKDMDSFSADCDKVQALFSAGFLRVADRALHITQTTRTDDLDVCDIVLTLEYHDETVMEVETAPIAAGVEIVTEYKTHD